VAIVTDPIRRGNMAGEILNNELWVEAFETLKASYMIEALKAGPKDDLMRYRVIEAIRQVETVKAHFEAVLAIGKLTMEQAAQFEEPRTLLKRFF
jgi:hypothetical protein